jgi:hypothetical protein
MAATASIRRRRKGAPEKGGDGVERGKFEIDAVAAFF